ncbi:MAG: hypothetical protein K2Y27_26745 [Xanthobacteraceae bacterium]|nr:hypothetical protein [Xanthobacteraceae bacterium]
MYAAARTVGLGRPGTLLRRQPGLADAHAVNRGLLGERPGERVGVGWRHGKAPPACGGLHIVARHRPDERRAQELHRIARHLRRADDAEPQHHVRQQLAAPIEHDRESAEPAVLHVGNVRTGRDDGVHAVRQHADHRRRLAEGGNRQAHHGLTQSGASDDARAAASGSASPRHAVLRKRSANAPSPTVALSLRTADL